jgi:uncharacterized protein (TIGR02145 family)
MKSNTEGWVVPNTGATNASGFSALAGGYGQNGTIYQALGFYGLWWSSTETDLPIYDSTASWSIRLSNNSKEINRVIQQKAQAFSVRCLKD